MDIEERFIKQAIELSLLARQHGNHPFGALLVINDQVVLTAENTVNTANNPTCHAETNLVQKAIQHLTIDQIASATLYTSCEPCAMCTGTIYWSGINRVVYALGGDDLAKLAGRNLEIGCREIFARARREVEVSGPHSIDEAAQAHEGYWEGE